MTKLWQPTDEQIRNTRLFEFLNSVDRLKAGTVDYAAAHAWSIEQPGDFWNRVWDFCGVNGDKGEIIFEPHDEMMSAKFFPEAKLNFAENILRRQDKTPAIIATAEDNKIRRISWAELNDQVVCFASWLKQMNIECGDRVAAVMPNIPETVMAMLGSAACGAVFSSCSPDFGEQGILDRFGQIEPRVLIVCDGYRYNGTCYDIRHKIKSVIRQLPSIEHVVFVRHLGLASIDGVTEWSDIQQQPKNASFTFEKFPFSSPLYVLFTSGTTGKPKCIIHSAGGTLLQHLKEHQLHCNIKSGDRVYYFTTCGWMMWNWLVSVLASDATILLYDGSPFHPDGNALFNYIEGQKATFFGTSAKFIDAVRKTGLEPRKTHDLSSVRTIASTGSPLAPESFDFVYQSIKQDVQLASVSGGTDIVSCFVCGNPCGPVYRGEIQVAALAMAVEIWDETGKRIINEKGELVCTKPFPSMPIGFWDDPDRAKYKAAYFEKFANVWCHGDFAIETERGGYLILGRSDATLNPGGVRIGTAEIYRQVEQLDEVAESLAVGQQWQGDVRVILFVVLRRGALLTDELVDAIKEKIRRGASPRHVPAKIISVPDIPRTKSGKITELAVRDIIHGRGVDNTEALANPEALAYFENLPDLAI